MARYADLEIALRKRDERYYAAAFRYNGPDDAAEQASDPDPVIAFDPASIRAVSADEYGRRLSAAFFNDDVKREFLRFRAQTKDASLRVRLRFEASAPELHAVRWETLRDPDAPEAPLFLGERVILSRFLANSQDSTPIRLRPKSDLTALVVVANPTTFNLPPVPVADEVADAQAALAGIQVTTLAPGGAVSLNDLAGALRPGFDILYLVCHGALKDDEPYLCLEDGVPVAGAQLVQRIRELDQRPRLVVLASCQSAGEQGVGLAGLGPRLAAAGVPAVVAMQGMVKQATSRALVKRFFAELLSDGQIDRAMSVARGDVREEPDYWMPVLFLRLRNGRIWYVPGFEGSKSDFEQWSSLCQFVREGECVPIIGPDLAEHVFGNARALATQLARAANFPLEEHDQSDLAKVAQYLLTQHSPEFAQNQVLDAIIGQLKVLAGRSLGRDVSAADPLDLMMELVRTAAADDPLRLLANLNAKVFVNAANDSLFELYLSQAQVNGQPKQPTPILVEWRDERRDDHAGQAFLGDPTVEKPFVYYVFGKSSEPSTWVLTQDDFFDYLIRTTRFDLMPGRVSEELVSGSLLFLGFPLDDWKFRVLFRLILAKGGRALLQGFNHVGVQVDPAETSLANARRAKAYLERYFLNSKIDIYWGSSADFVRDLQRHLDTAPAPAPVRRKI
jgi:hypothetical protein